MKVTGELSKEFFGGDVWVLRVPGGATYELKGSIPSKLEGRTVTVQASPAEAQMGFSMIGEILQVSAIREA